MGYYYEIVNLHFFMMGVVVFLDFRNIRNGDIKMARKKKALGTGHYSKRIYLQATKMGAALFTSRNTVAKPRKMYRENLLKWVINPKNIDKERGIIKDPRTIIPYNRKKNYGTIVEALMTKLEPRVKDIEGQFSKDFSEIKEWSGVFNPEIKAIEATDWIWASDLYAISRKINSHLHSLLKNRKSDRPGVKHHIEDPFQKFQNNVTTIQRYSSKTEGGITPYAWPLMKVQMAIDSRWRFNAHNKPELQYRLVIGRSRPMRGLKYELKTIKLDSEKSRLNAKNAA